MFAINYLTLSLTVWNNELFKIYLNTYKHQQIMANNWEQYVYKYQLKFGYSKNLKAVKIIGTW